MAKRAVMPRISPQVREERRVRDRAIELALRLPMETQGYPSGMGGGGSQPRKRPATEVVQDAGVILAFLKG